MSVRPNLDPERIYAAISEGVRAGVVESIDARFTRDFDHDVLAAIRQGVTQAWPLVEHIATAIYDGTADALGESRPA